MSSGFSLRSGLLAAALAAAASGAAGAQAADSAQAVADSAALPSPRGAAVRALVAPGWGQVYAGQPLKAPVAAAAVGGSLVYAVVRQRQYERLRRATLVAGCHQDPDSTPARIEVCADAGRYAATWEAAGSPTFGQVAPLRDRARGRRDIAVLLVGVVYAVQALDAYVAAELADFDVSDDLAVRVQPEGAGASVALRVRL